MSAPYEAFIASHRVSLNQAVDRREATMATAGSRFDEAEARVLRELGTRPDDSQEAHEAYWKAIWPDWLKMWEARNLASSAFREEMAAIRAEINKELLW